MCKHYEYRSWKVMMVPLVGVSVLLLILSSCRPWESSASERTFTTEELLINQSIVPASWDLTNPTFPTGDELCTDDSATIGYTVDDDLAIQGGTHSVYRHQNARIASRTFEKVYLAMVRSFSPVDEWTYQSQTANLSYFGCHNMAGNVGVYCKWGGQYEEYIMVLGMRLPPGEISLSDIEQMEVIIRTVDMRMAEYLNQSDGNNED